MLYGPSCHGYPSPQFVWCKKKKKPPKRHLDGSPIVAGEKKLIKPNFNWTVECYLLYMTITYLWCSTFVNRLKSPNNFNEYKCKRCLTVKRLNRNIPWFPHICLFSSFIISQAAGSVYRTYCSVRCLKTGSSPIFPGVCTTRTWPYCNNSITITSASQTAPPCPWYQPFSIKYNPICGLWLLLLQGQPQSTLKQMTCILLLLLIKDIGVI